MTGVGCRVSGFGFQVSGFKFRVSGVGFRVSGGGCLGSGFGVWDSGFRFQIPNTHTIQCARHTLSSTLLNPAKTIEAPVSGFGFRGWTWPTTNDAASRLAYDSRATYIDLPPLNVRTTTLDKCAVVPTRAQIERHVYRPAISQRKRPPINLTDIHSI